MYERLSGWLVDADQGSGEKVQSYTIIRVSVGGRKE